MKLVSHKELHNEWMKDEEYRAASGRRTQGEAQGVACRMA